MSKFRVVAVVFAALVMGACGNDVDSSSSGKSDSSDSSENSTTETVELSGDDQEYVDALVESMSTDDNAGFPPDQAECWATRLVDDFGADRLEEIGLTAESMGSDEGPALTDLTESETADFKAGFVDCIDLVEVMVASAEADGTEDTAAMKECLSNSVTDKTEEAFAEVLIMGDAAAENDPKLQAAMAPIMGCAFMGLGDAMDDMSEDTTTTTG
jgi:hypothetical protein